MDPEISIIVPCLNEEQNIPILVQKLDSLMNEYELSAEILIVDDCSDDYTFREAFILSKSYPKVFALHKGLPRGIGNAIRFGIKHAKGRVGVIVMGDLVDPLAAIPDFRDKIIDEGCQLVLLSRYMTAEDHANIPLSYRFYQYWFRLLSRIFVGVKVTDITYAFRAFDLDFIKSLDLQSGGFEISPEITLKAWLKSARICELKGRQGRRVRGESKFLFSKQGWGYGGILAKAFFARIFKRWV